MKEVRKNVKNDASELLITYQKIGEIKNNPRNSRTHSKRQIRQIGDSIQEFGFTNPVLLDRNNIVIAGHGRVTAAKLLGRSQVLTIRLENLSPGKVFISYLCLVSHFPFFHEFQ